MTSLRHAYWRVFLFMRSPCLFTLSYDTFVIHQRGRGDRKIYDRDSSARNYCYSRRVQILACIRTEGGLGVGWGGGGTISSVTNLVFTPGQEGKVIRYPWPMLAHRHAHSHTHARAQTHTHENTEYVKKNKTLNHVFVGSCLRVKDISAVEFDTYTVTHTDLFIYRLPLTWTDITSIWLCPVNLSAIYL